MESIMKKMDVKKFAAAALLGIFALGGGFAAWSASPSPAAAHHGRWNCDGPRRGDCPYDGQCYDRQPGENYGRDRRDSYRDNER